MLPIEIIEILLKHSSGIDIINYRLVCKTWNSIIARLSKDTNLWQVKCKTEMPIHSCKTILNKLYPNESWFDFYQSENNSKWLRIYQSWITWDRIKEARISRQQFEPFFIRLPNVKVTCVSVSDNLLAVGSSEGFIAFYDVDISTNEPIFIVDQMAYVSDVQFFRYGSSIFQLPFTTDKQFTAVSSSDLGHIMVWDIKSKTASGGKRSGRLISTTQGCLCIARNHELRILAKNNKHSYHISPLYGIIVALTADSDEAFLLTGSGLYVNVNLNEPNVNYIEKYIEPPAAKVCKYYLFVPWIAVCITRDGFLGVSINCGQWVMYEILSKLHGVPTCVLFYSNVLVLGLDSGSVHMYAVDKVECLADWDFRSENSQAIVVDNQAIVALDIMDRPNKQYLIAASAEKVNVVDINYLD